MSGQTILLRRLLIIPLIGVLVLLGSHTAKAGPAHQGANLLVNGGFEPFITADGKFDYPVVVTQEGGGHVAEGWSPWWYWAPDQTDIFKSYIVPEFDIAPIYRDPVRVHGGNASQQIFRPSTLWKAGVYQRVQVPANSTLTFSIYGHVWSGFCKSRPNDGPECGDNHDSFYGDGANPAHMRVGIDPTGGTDWTSPTIVWSQDYAYYDKFQQLVVSATAKGSFVTVFTYTTFDFPAVINNVYWDDAALVVGSSAASPGQSPTTPTGGSLEGLQVEAKSTVNVRAGASTNDTILGQIRPGTKYPVLGQSGLWYHIQFGTQKGFVYGPLVTVSNVNIAPGSGLEAKLSLNVRAGAGTSYPSLGVISPGTVYQIVDQVPGWYAITFKGQKGWVSAQYVTVH